jgi:phage terminase large subunit
VPFFDIKVPRVFLPLLDRNLRYLGARGGRGGGKSHFYAELLISRCVAEPGTRAVCIREIQRSLQQSVKTLVEDKIHSFNLGDQFQILETQIRTPGDGLIVFQGMQNHTANTIKSLEGFDVAFVEEAQTLSSRSLNMLRPTIRKPGSQLWFGWNPENETDAIDKFMCGPVPPNNSVVVKVNYTDNPWVTQELLDEAELDRADPAKFDHVWLGNYNRAIEGAYFASEMRQADEQGRIVPLEIDPIHPLKASWDIGFSDATAIWVAQWVGGRIHFVDYIEGERQSLGYYINELRSRGYGRAECILPHDAAQHEKVSGMTYEHQLREAGFMVPPPVRNQGRGAAMLRVQAMRRWFPRMWFDAEKTIAGRKALLAYHERRDPERGVGLGPEHDWASHASDAAGLMAVAYREPSTSIDMFQQRSTEWVV